MKIVVTCGPAYEPIDGARRLTNFSTGRLGVTLAHAFARQGWEVFCFKGEGATAPDPSGGVATQSFSTNEDLAARLQAVSGRERIGAVFHAAALCDFRVARVLDAAGREIASRKFPTREGHIQLVLTPALKVLPRLRDWFPQARIVGWKYELEGSREDAFARAWAQIRECRTDACVLNGAAYGEGFAFCAPPQSVTPCADAAGLAKLLVGWLAGEAAAEGLS